MKRGLAVSAISALALSGWAFAPASAQTVGQGENVPFDFYTQQFDASTLFDGSNNTVTMLSGVANGSGITEVRYSYMKGATQVEIDEVAPNNGVASIEWAPPGGAEGAAITGVRAEALDAAENVLFTENRGVSPADASGMADNGAIEFGGALRSRVGLGPDDEVVISGATTAIPALTNVRNAGPNGVGPFVAPLPADQTAPDGNGVSQFKVAVPVDPTNDTGDAEDEIVVHGLAQEIGGPGDDANVYTMYNQVVTNATIATAPGFPANIQLGGADDETRWNITVVDQEGKPVQGLDVFEVENANAGAPADGSGNATPNTGETNVNGVAQVSMFESTMDTAEDNDGVANQQTAFYVVDVNEDGNYDDGVDYRFTLVQSGIVPVATTVEITSEKGLVLDDDEVTDITATVKDQNGQPIANKSTVISAHLTCYDNNGDVEFEIDQPPAAGLTNANGQLVFNNVGNRAELACEDGWYEITVDAFANNNGTPQPDAGDAIAETLVLDYDATHIEWDNGSRAQALNGTTTSQTGTLVQDTDGDALGADRVIAITYDNTPFVGAPNNSEIADAQTAPTQKVNDLQATSETNAQGKFSVAVTDPALPDGQELDNELTAQASGLEGPFGNDETDATIDIDFLRSITPDRIRIINPNTGDESDGLAAGLLGTDLRPGGLGVGEVEVENSDGIVLTDVDVDLTIDEGHFVDIFDTPFEPGAPGDALDWQNDGQTFTVTTDDNGSAVFFTNIERHEGFDDDGEVDDNMTADAGPASDVHDLTWSTNNVPLNPRATDPLVVELSADQESSILPKARAGHLGGVGQVVDYDVATYDQFGNRTAQPTTVTDNTPIAGFFGGGQSEFDLNQPAISAFSNGTVDQELEVELDGSIKVTYQDDPETSEFDPNNPLLALNSDPVQVETNTDAINWYEVNYGASEFTLGQIGPENVPAQSAVTEVLEATDQEGQPLENLVVDFLRGGPGNEDDDSCNEDILNNCLVTDGDGEAFYDFVGGSIGTATITAVVYEPVVDGGARITTVGPDTVQFGANVVPIKANLSGKSKGNKDVLKVNAPNKAAGAVVKLQKKVDGKWKQIGPAKALNDAGNAKFSVRDKNGNKVTKYRAKVSGTVDTKGDTTNVVRQR